MTETLEIIIDIGVMLLGVNVLMLLSIIGIWVTAQIQMRRAVNSLKDISTSMDSWNSQEKYGQLKKVDEECEKH